MDYVKTAFIWNSILRMVAFICITAAAIYFGKIAVLWFYLIPMFMGVESKKEKKDDGKSDGSDSTTS